jgi:quercetin 2,3-dioxygenase
MEGDFMIEPNKIQMALKSRTTREGAGVQLERVFGFDQTPLFDPFLLLDNFSSDDPEKYLKGFPWHPHRGIETITYVTSGEVEHEDSLGNKGIIRSGDVQWMTAGSGIIHQEMPNGDRNGKLSGFQLWVNLPARHKMMSPKYQEVTSGQIPLIKRKNGITIRLIAGKIDDQHGPVHDVVIDPEYLDIFMPAGTEFKHKMKNDHTVFSYITSGKGYFGENSDEIFEAGNEIKAVSGCEGLTFLLISGKPIGEPVAWYGPIVMNTKDELKVAFEEYKNGSFIKHG